MGPIGTPEIIIIGVIVILLFGAGKISGLGKDLGSSIKEFRRAVKDEDKVEPPPVQQAQQYTPPPAQQTPQYTPPPAAPAQPPTQQGENKNPNIF